jgi:hypothetical protein
MQGGRGPQESIPGRQLAYAPQVFASFAASAGRASIWHNHAPIIQIRNGFRPDFSRLRRIHGDNL